MAKINLRQLIFTVQLTFVAVSFISVEVNGLGNYLNWGKQLTGSAARSLVKVPSKLMDGSQYATHKVAGTVGNAVSPVKPLKTAVDATGRMVSNVLGSTSRLLGKDVRPAHDVMFLYGRPLAYLGTSWEYQQAVKAVIGLALSNVVLHADEMADDGSIDVGKMPVLGRVVRSLRSAGAERPDINDIVWLLGRNGKADITEDMEKQILGALKDTNGNFRTRGVIEDIRWIAQNPHGFYRLNETESNDYKLNTDNLYSSCTVIYPPTLETMARNQPQSKSEVNN